MAPPKSESNTQHCKARMTQNTGKRYCPPGRKKKIADNRNYWDILSRILTGAHTHTHVYIHTYIYTRYIYIHIHICPYKQVRSPSFGGSSVDPPPPGRMLMHIARAIPGLSEEQRVARHRVGRRKRFGDDLGIPPWLQKAPKMDGDHGWIMGYQENMGCFLATI